LLPPESRNAPSRAVEALKGPIGRLTLSAHIQRFSTSAMLMRMLTISSGLPLERAGSIYMTVAGSASTGSVQSGGDSCAAAKCKLNRRKSANNAFLEPCEHNVLIETPSLLTLCSYGLSVLKLMLRRRFIREKRGMPAFHVDSRMLTH